MKINIKNLGNLMVLGFLMLTIASCKKLTLQDKFEFNPEVPILEPYKNMTALEFLKLDPKNEFNYMRKVIALTGMEAEYSGEIKNRTYLLLKDTAFVTGFSNYPGITKDLTGVDKGDLATVDVARLKKLLSYHIINEYVDQLSPSLPKKQVDYFFQTLVPGDEGRVSIRRSELLGLSFNQSSLIPNVPSGTKKNTNLVQSNYVFKNGVGHLLSNYIRYKPF
jgi:hypothetical protein